MSSSTWESDMPVYCMSERLCACLCLFVLIEWLVAGGLFLLIFIERICYGPLIEDDDSIVVH